MEKFVTTVKVKICGLTRKQDVRAAAEAGADMLGFVFARSPRQLSIRDAGALMHDVPDGITRVGLFMNDRETRVKEVVESLSLDLLQFHGDEENGFCASFGLPFIKAISMGTEAGGDKHTVTAKAGLYPDAAGYLYDAHRPGMAGGTGSTFDWSLLGRGEKRLWLAGGLTPENVERAVAQVRPWAVDTSSGVEDRPGCKNHALMQAFVTAAKSVDMDG